MKIEIAKGVRDTNPEEKILKSFIVDTLRKTFEEYGFNPLDTPIIERFEVLASKYAGGEEILKETFRLSDQGDRDLCLRYDLTVPLARYTAMNPTLKMPFKRYQIGQVFRDGPIKLGRYREFTQCDVDIIGTKNLLADIELLKIASVAFKKIGLDIEIKFNDRNLLDSIMKSANISEDKIIPAILSLDKIEKIGQSEVEKEMISKDLTKDMIDKLFSMIKRKENNIETLNNISIEDEAKKDVKRMIELLDVLDVNANFYPNLARGLAYYTGTVFEIFATDSKVTSSIAAGGRYDKMIGNFARNNQEYPAVGISFGLDVIFEAIKLKSDNLQSSVVKILVIPINTQNESIKIVTELRNSGINSDISFKKGVSKSLDYAASYKIPFVLFVGENEVKENKFKLRNMDSGKEEMLTIGEITKKLK